MSFIFVNLNMTINTPISIVLAPHINRWTLVWCGEVLHVLDRSADSDWRGWDSSKCALSFLSKHEPGTHRSDSPPQTAFSESNE